MSWSNMSIVPMIIMTMSITTSDLMELNTIGRCFVFFGSIESYMREIVPDREYNGTDNIG
jgi:hypothetical protein